MNEVYYYSPLEEKINISSHALGLVLSIAALVLLITRASTYGTVWHIVSFSVFGASLLVLYAASTIYHSTKEPAARDRLRIVDHASIYILIAGTYTPFTLITLSGSVGWVIFSASWAMAVIGIVLKIFFTGKYDLISTLMYVFMGWIILFALEPLIENISSEGLFWLVAGGVAYTVGAMIYAIEKLRFNHAIFHVFVLMGSFCHFVSVYFYVLPIG
ncbi:MAG: hemolysin III family protein [Gammaproteobacteria bacterium]|nr:hemolysin III family protein [Gammaproteobacteria bacterium]